MDVWWQNGYASPHNHPIGVFPYQHIQIYIINHPIFTPHHHILYIAKNQYFTLSHVILISINEKCSDASGQSIKWR